MYVKRFDITLQYSILYLTKLWSTMFNDALFCYQMFYNHLDGVIVNVLAASVIDPVGSNQRLQKLHLLLLR